MKLKTSIVVLLTTSLIAGCSLLEAIVKPKERIVVQEKIVYEERCPNVINTTNRSKVTVKDIRANIVPGLPCIANAADIAMKLDQIGAGPLVGVPLGQSTQASDVLLAIINGNPMQASKELVASCTKLFESVGADVKKITAKAEADAEKAQAAIVVPLPGRLK